MPGGLRLVEVCLDEFKFATHPGRGGVEFHSSPSGWSLLHVGEISEGLAQRLWEEVYLRLEEARSVPRDQRHADNAESHQKTPSFIFSLLQNAIKTVIKLPDMSMVDVDKKELRRLRREDDKKPRGGFTDVGRHTGGEPRHTSWPLLLATIEAAVTHIFPTEAAGGHPNPRGLCRQASAHFVLWQLQCGVNGLDDATPDRLQQCMVMLREAAERCVELVDLGLDMRSFSSACKEAREALEKAREERAEKCALQYHLPDVKQCAEASEWRNVVLALPEEAVCEAEGDSEELVRERAKSNLGYIPLIPTAKNDPSAAGLVRTSKWLNDLQPASSNTKIMQIAMRGVEEYLFSFSRSDFELVVDSAGMEDSEEVTALVNIVNVYRSVHESFLESLAAPSRMRTVLLGRRTLVEWVSFCLIHSICCNIEPILLKYGVALCFSELDHLSLDDKLALGCCMKVSDYLRKYSKPDREVFSLRSRSSEQATLDMAYEIATQGTFKQVFKVHRETDKERARLREKKYWEEVERKQALARLLRRDIASKQQEIRGLGDELSLTVSPRRELQDLKERAQRELQYLHSQLREAEKAPPPLFHNLPSIDRNAYEALFFLHMSQSFRALSEMSFSAQELLLPSPWQQPKDTVAPDFYPGGGWNIVKDIHAPSSETTWEDLYIYQGTYHTSPRNTPTVGKVFLRDTSATLPETVGPKHVDRVNHGNHGIFYPDVFSRQMGWDNGSGEGCINPFARLDKNWRILTHTEQLSEPSEPKQSLQWAMPMLEGDVTKSRGNWAFALQHCKPTFLTKQEFLSFCSLRSFPLQQNRKLCCFLHGNLLPLNRLDVHVLLRQAMYQVGEIKVSKHGAKCFPFWKTDLLNEEFRSDLVGEMERLCDKLRNTPRDHKSVLILGELCGFLADFDLRFHGVRILFAEVVRGWVEELHVKMTSVEPKHAPGFRGKQRMFCLYIVSFFAAGPIDAHGCGLLLDALVLFENGAVFEDETDFDADIKRLLVVAHNIMGGRVHDVIATLDENPSVLTNAVRKAVEDVPTDAMWKPSQGDKPLSSQRSSCYEAVAGKDMYHINIITGVVLVNGKPPRGLPQSIRTHALFRRTFGDVNFDVVEPAEKPGVFRTSNKVGGRFFYDFSLHDEGARLCVLEEDTEQEDLALRVVELLDGVDSSEWGGDLPVRLRELHSHWLSRSMEDSSLKGVVILRGINFRDRGVHFVFMGSQQRKVRQTCSILSDGFVGSKVPLNLRSEPWSCTAKNYGLDKLVLPRDSSDCAQRMISLLSKFESPTFIHVYRLDSSRHKGSFFDPPSGPSVFRIEMPRFALSFQLDSSHLSSEDFADYVVASHQKLTKTLFEFDKYIVLSLNATVDIEPRPTTIVVVPDGCVRRDEEGAVTVCTRDSRDENRCDAVRVSFDYGFHKRLDHLVARNSASRLHLAALYAASGTLLPETVLRMTGTQLACELVRQCWKNSPLSADEFAHLQDVVSFCAHSPSLALVCRELEQSSSQLIKLHGMEVRREKLHFPHFGPPCWHGTPMGCDSVQDYKTAYLHERRSTVHHARLALTVEEEKAVLGVVSCTSLFRVQKMKADHQRVGQIHRWFKFADDVSRGLKYLSGEGDVSDVTEPVGMSGWLSRLQQQKRKKAKLHHQPAGPGAVFPLSHLEATISTTLGREMMDELKESWQTCDQLVRDKAKKRPPCLDIHALLCAFDEALQAVRKRREESEHSLFTWMRAVPKDDGQGVQIETMWAADLLPLPTKHDFLKIAMQNDALRAFNPLLSNDQTISRAAVAWAVLCVLEDKLQRLQEYGKRQEAALIFKELEVWREWDADKYPEWLVMEVEGRVQIRNKQYHVASHLLDAKNHGDIVQLNMGEGKTRFVLPMVWLVLSKTGRERNQPDWLVRATFLSALLAEARDYLQLYTSASVLRKRLYFMPFHRDVELSHLDLLLLQETLYQCRRTGGLLMVAPEHRNSLALKAQEWHFDPSNKARLDILDDMMTGGQMPFFDILDESDLILSHQYQLVYAVGSPCELSDGERRWFAAEAVLRAIAQDPEVWRILCMPDVSQASEGSLSSAYPRVQLICGKALEEVSADLVDAICNAVIERPPYPFRWFENKSIVQKEICKQIMTDRAADTARFCKGISLLEYKDLLAFRGLFSHDILLHLLQKRFGVDYGLKKPLGEKRMAVPYRAADTPSERSEFAHPDCSIVQTYLSYYYQGLDDDQVLEALHKLLSPGMGTERRRKEYEEWLNLSRPDMTQRHWESLNMVDKIDFSNGEQMELACHYFRSNYETINFFLANCVLPSDTQQYPHKLVTSAWNLAENCEGGATIGFSGTNDHHRLLPQQVRQADPGDDELTATNGKMLNILVQNDRLVELESSAGTVWQQVMNVCLEQNVSALIDSGGILAGISNLEAAKQMLQKLVPSRDLKGVTYFDVKHSSWTVLSAADTQSKRLSNSPIRERDTFVIYDESRCRGADLKLNNNAVALVTLGLKMCKDKLMQAAARMRKLSEGLRLVFLVTPEVAVQVRAHSQLEKGSKLTVHHILAWVMHNTVRSTSSGLTQWAEKGMVFATTYGCREVCRIEEKLDLEKLYARPLHKTSSDQIMRATQKLLVDRRAAVSPTCTWEQKISNWIYRIAGKYGREFEVEANVLDEECEKELEREEEEEEEEERQVAKREPRVETDTTLQSLTHSMHGGVNGQLAALLLRKMLEKFVVTERVQGRDSTQHIAWSERLYCTLNFFQTVQEQGLGFDTLNEYLRSPDVAILMDGKALLLSDREADQVLRDSQFGTNDGTITLVHTSFAVSLQKQGASVPYPLSLPAGAVNRLSSASAASILLFNGETVYPDSDHKNEVERMLMQGEAAKVGAINIVRMRGNIDSFIRSDLDKIVGPGVAESMK